MSNKEGFSFIEIIVALAIIAIMLTVFMFQFKVKNKDGIDYFTLQLTDLITFAYEQATALGVQHRLLFDMGQKKIMLQKMDFDDKKVDQYRVVEAAYQPTHLSWNDTLEIKNLFINGIDSVKQGKEQSPEILFFADGTTTQTIINIMQVSSQEEKSILINPITGSVDIYDSFKYSTDRV